MATHPNYRYAIVVGASSGVGEEIVRQLAARGTRVAALARRKPRLEALAERYPTRVIPIEHDVQCREDLPALFTDLCGKLGGLDLLIYAAGIMPEVGPDEYDFAKDEQTFDVNTVAAVAWLDLAAQRFSGARAGHIVVIGSVAGDRGRMGQPAYNASKAALAAFAEALRNRLDRQGVTVCTIKPGPLATEMTAHLGFRNAMSASLAAERTLERAHRSGEFYLMTRHRILFWVIRHIPSWVFRRLNI
jgi:short-subunit dehydrogenase